jgi:hypothetical protein
MSLRFRILEIEYLWFRVLHVQNLGFTIRVLSLYG